MLRHFRPSTLLARGALWTYELHPILGVEGRCKATSIVGAWEGIGYEKEYLGAQVDRV